jgi:hypothetical protein
MISSPSPIEPPGGIRSVIESVSKVEEGQFAPQLMPGAESWTVKCWSSILFISSAADPPAEARLLTTRMGRK